MTDEQWRLFLFTCSQVLGAGQPQAWRSNSWCAWTTFESLVTSLHYWAAGIPAERDLGATGTTDGGAWGQPFSYKSLAHVIVPREFYWERQSGEGFEHGTRRQDLGRLSAELKRQQVPHRATELVVEVKLF